MRYFSQGAPQQQKQESLFQKVPKTGQQNQKSDSKTRGNRKNSWENISSGEDEKLEGTLGGDSSDSKEFAKNLDRGSDQSSEFDTDKLGIDDLLRK